MNEKVANAVADFRVQRASAGPSPYSFNGEAWLDALGKMYKLNETERRDFSDIVMGEYGERHDKRRQFVHAVASLLKDGEKDEEGKKFDLRPDDAIDTLHSLISDARKLTEVKHGVRN